MFRWMASMGDSHKSWIRNDKQERNMGTCWTTWRTKSHQKPMGIYTKFDNKGNLMRFKAHIVMQGFSQMPRQGFLEMFSPIMQLDSFCTLCALATMQNLKIAQRDIKGVYLNGILEEEIYMCQPEGFTDSTECICKLRHTLYGLKQSRHQ